MVARRILMIWQEAKDTFLISLLVERGESAWSFSLVVAS
jgi:hypothetical protein